MLTVVYDDNACVLLNVSAILRCFINGSVRQGKIYIIKCKKETH